MSSALAVGSGSRVSNFNLFACLEVHRYSASPAGGGRTTTLMNNFDLGCYLEYRTTHEALSGPWTCSLQLGVN